MTGISSKMADRHSITEVVRQRITKYCEKDFEYHFKQLLEQYLSWFDQGGNSSSCESISSLGKRMYDIFYEIDETVKGNRGKDCFG